MFAHHATRCSFPLTHSYLKTMLILTLRPDKKICIGDDTVITLLGNDGNEVTLTIESDQDITTDYNKPERSDDPLP